MPLKFIDLNSTPVATVNCDIRKAMEALKISKQL